MAPGEGSQFWAFLGPLTNFPQILRVGGEKVDSGLLLSNLKS